MTELSHSVLSPVSFRVEYKRAGSGPTMFQRHVRIQVSSSNWITFEIFTHFFPLFFAKQVDINTICKQSDVADMLFAITFTLLSGNIRRFRRICEHIQTQVCSKRFPALKSPSNQSKMSTTVSESLSNESNCSERINFTRPVMILLNEQL